MRKINKNKNITISKLTILFIISLLAISIGYSLLSTTLEVKGTASIETETEQSNLKIEYTKNYWGNNPFTYQFDVKVTNISGAPLTKWSISVPVEEGTKVAAIWNAKAEIVNNKLVISNGDYNGSLANGDSATFGIQVTTSEKNFELKKDLNGSTSREEEEINPDTPTEEDPKEDDPKEDPEEPEAGIKNVEITYGQSAKWASGDGYMMIFTVKIKNLGDRMTAWSLKINKPSDVRYEIAWNANYIEQDDLLIFSNVGYNGIIEKNKEVNFSFEVFSKSPDYFPTTKSIKETY